jgi:hypothetical protein
MAQLLPIIEETSLKQISGTVISVLCVQEFIHEKVEKHINSVRERVILSGFIFRR